MTSRASFPDDPASAAAARSFTREALSGLASQAIDRAMLVVSELASNAIRHGHSDFVLTIDTTQVDAAHVDVRIEVSDDSQSLPVLAAPDLLAPAGRGLVIVAALSQRWGVTTRPRGKAVWAVLSTSASLPAAG